MSLTLLLHAINDGKVSIHGRVLEGDPPRRLVMTWLDSSVSEPQDSHVTFTIEPVGEMVRLDVIYPTCNRARR